MREKFFLLAIFLVSLSFLISSVKAQDPWWSSQWNYRRNITITLSGEPYTRNFEPVEIFVDASSWSNKPYNDSIRIINKPCGDDTGVEIPSVVYNITQTNGMMNSFTVAFEANTTSQNTVYCMYYDTSSKGQPSYQNFIQVDWNNYQIANKYLKLDLRGMEVSSYGGKMWINFTSPTTNQTFPTDHNFMLGIFSNGQYWLKPAYSYVKYQNPVFVRVVVYYNTTGTSYLNATIDLWANSKDIILGKEFGIVANTNPTYMMLPYNDVDAGGTWSAGYWESSTGTISSTYDYTTQKKWLFDWVTFPSPRQNAGLCFVQPDYSNTSLFQYWRFWTGHDDGFSLVASAVNTKARFIYRVTNSNDYTLCQDAFRRFTNTSSYLIGTEEVSLSMTISDVSEVKSFQPTEFIKVNGTNLMLGGQPYRFVGMNSYYLVDYATNFTYDDDGNPIYNSRQYVLEVLNEMHYLNLNVLRTWGGMECGYAGHSYSVWDCSNSGGHYNAFQKYTHGNWSEEMYQALDWLIYEAGKRDIRIALVLVNNWKEYGGMRWYVQQSPTTNKTWENITDDTDSRFWEFHDQFYSDANAKQYFKDFINHTLWRNNTYTGRYYKDEPAIAAWILANEPRAKSQGNNYTLIRNWTQEMANYIRSIDQNHIIALGMEGWGDPFEGTAFIKNQDLGNLSIATYNVNPYQWDWFAQRSEHATDLDWVDEGWNTSKVIDWWTNNTSLSYNNRYETGYIPNYNPNLGRHGYKDWVRQHVDWANINLSKPIMAMEILYPLRKGKVAVDGDKATYDLRVKFFNQTVKNFFDNGGDGLLFWVLQHDNYYWSTENSSYAGKMDDGFGFYVSDNATLSDSSKPVIDTLTWIRDSGYVNLLNDYKYNFNYKPIINGANPKNATLYLFINNENGTSYTVEVTNTSEIKNGDLNAFTYQFRRVAGNSDKNFTYIIEVCSDNPDLGCMNTTQSGTIIILTTKPAIVLNSPAEKRYPSLTQIFYYTVSADLDITYCQLFINGTANKTSTNIVKDTPQTFVVDFDKEGSYEWYVVCSDTQSNLGNSSKRDIIIGSPKWSDLQTSIYGTKININITWNDSLGYSIDTVLIENNFTGIAKNDTMVLIDAYINATEKKGVYNFNATLALGAYYYKIYANASDGVWNSTPTQNVFITQEITIFSPLNRSYYGGIDFTFKAIDGLDENFTVRTYLNNQLEYENLYYQNNTQTSYSKSLPTGTYNFTVYAEDSHGNSLQKEVIFTSLGYCGDNVCQADYENSANCFKDCGGASKNFVFLVVVGLGIMGIIIGRDLVVGTKTTEEMVRTFVVILIILVVIGIIASTWL